MLNVGIITSRMSFAITENRLFKFHFQEDSNSPVLQNVVHIPFVHTKFSEVSLAAFVSFHILSLTNDLFFLNSCSLLI